MPTLQRQPLGVVATDDVIDILECTATTANYAEWVATDLTVNVPSESLARHSLVFGIYMPMPGAA